MLLMLLIFRYTLQVKLIFNNFTMSTDVYRLCFFVAYFYFLYYNKFGDIMPKYKIADIVVEIRSNFDLFEKISKDYLYAGDEPANFKIEIREDYLKKRAEKNTHLSISDVENVLLADAFNKRILKYNAMLLHSSAIFYNGKAFLFSADSGVGKSTHTKRWIEKFGVENVKIINDDKPIIRYVDNEWYVYGSPFDGGTGINMNIRAKLGAIIFIERAERNSIQRLDKNNVFTRLYNNTAKFSLNSEYAGYMLETSNKLILDNDFYLLKCNMNIEAAEICEKFLTNGR